VALPDFDAKTSFQCCPDGKRIEKVQSWTDADNRDDSLGHPVVYGSRADGEIAGDLPFANELSRRM
jgi:hypothetical protein